MEHAGLEVQFAQIRLRGQVSFDFALSKIPSLLALSLLEGIFTALGGSQAHEYSGQALSGKSGRLGITRANRTTPTPRYHRVTINTEFIFVS